MAVRMSRVLLGLSAVLGLLATGACGASGRVGEPPPTRQVLKDSCEQAFATASEQLADVDDRKTVDNDLGFRSSGRKSAGTVTCDGNAWLGTVDGRKNTRIEMAVRFTPVPDPQDPAEDYCQTEGVSVSLPRTDFETRGFGDQDYCFTWDDGDVNQSVSASYVDHGTEVYVMWNFRFDEDFADGQLPRRYADLVEAVLTGIRADFDDA